MLGSFSTFVNTTRKFIKQEFIVKCVMLITAHVKRDHAKEYAAAEEAVKTKAADKKVVPITNFFGAQRFKNKWSKTE